MHITKCVYRVRKCFRAHDDFENNAWLTEYTYICMRCEAAAENQKPI